MPELSAVEIHYAEGSGAENNLQICSDVCVAIKLIVVYHNDRYAQGGRMVKKISSAGLAYAYFNGYEDDGLLYVDTVDSYRYMPQAFYRQVAGNISLADGKAVHVFAVLSDKKKISEVYKGLEKGIRDNYQRILSGKPIVKSSAKLDEAGNDIFRCVQEFFCEEANHFPRGTLFDCGDFSFAGIFCSGGPQEDDNGLANEVISMWLSLEKPVLQGKQLMLRSFLLRGLEGRRLVACFPQRITGEWNLVFEGGHRLTPDGGIDDMTPSFHLDELGGFVSSNVQSVLMNPAYAYGILLRPAALCEEWHKAFLYLCAVSEYPWDRSSIAAAYEKFLDILKKDICCSVEAESIISKDLFHDALLAHIERYRGFLRGEDEPVVSKDLHHTMNSRYIYLWYLWNIVPIKEQKASFSLTTLRETVSEAVSAKNIYKKGVLWEDAATYVLKNIPGWKITGRRVRAGSQEIDISVANVSLDDELWELGAYILVE